MMFSVTLKDDAPWQAHNWNNGEPKPIKHNQVVDVVEVFASGDELKFIRLAFTGIPDCPMLREDLGITWFGDDAKFIVAHLA